MVRRAFAVLCGACALAGAHASDAASQPASPTSGVAESAATHSDAHQEGGPAASAIVRPMGTDPVVASPAASPGPSRAKAPVAKPAGLSAQDAMAHDIFLSAARNAMARKEVPEAVKRFEALLARFPWEDDGRIEYAGALAQAGRLADSAREYKAMILKYPARLELEDALGDVDVTQHDYPAALLSYATALAGGQDLVIRGKIARVTLWQGQFPRALGLMQALLDEKFEQPDLWPSYLDACCGVPRLEERQHLCALRLFDAYFARPGKDPVVLVRLATVLRRTKEPEKSVVLLEKAVALDPRDRGVRLMLADTEHEIGQLTKAEENYKLLLQALPDKK